ncbi:MAG: PASTA domain-containing protein [Candidatus Contendobacter sp.]|nr:MAG: PASTA domain-containing protein [Candidatus Contendobacter sp.]
MKSRIRLFSTSFLLILIGFILSAYPQISSAANVNVPNVVGQTEANARSTITGTCDAGTPADPGPPAVPAVPPVCLKVTVTYAFSTTVTAGNVISQDPPGGAAVPSNTTVAIVVAYRLTVPNVVGQPQNTATLTINNTCVTGTALCLTTGTVTQQASSTVPAGTVISQDPAAGFLTTAGSKVNLVVSSGAPLLTVPNVVGKTQFDAETAIKTTCVTGTTQCLVVGAVTFQTSDTVPAGSVISQAPPSGVQVGVGTAVNLVVSSGRSPIAVPNVIGLPLATARTAIEGTCSTGDSPVCLKVGTVTLAASDTVPAGNVISQNPGGGTLVAPGTAVNLVISSGKEAPINPPVPPGAIEVPNVVGLTQAAAANTVRSVGLSVGAVLKQYSDTVPAGIVLAQSPAAGAKVAVGTPVSLTVSLGPAGVVKVPDVRGLPEEVAKSVLQDAGLTIGSTLRQPDPTMPAGNAIGTDPVAGTQVKLGSAVTLIISEGFSQPQEVAVPGEVIGMTVEDAREALFAVGLFHVGAITVQPHDTIAAGRVSGLSPTAGTMVAYGTTINLFVSSGTQPPVATPNVVGQTLANATAILQAAGLQLGFVSRQTSNTVEAGRVISQNPLMTALVPVGWKINLVVSLGPIPDDPGARPTTQVPDVVGLSLAAATAKLIDAGLQAGLVSNERSQDVPAGQVIRQNPPPDVTLPVSGKVNLVVSFGPHAYSLLSGPAYITNYAGGTVSIVNPDINQAVDNIPSGINNVGPSGIAVHPDGTRLYVANRPKFGRTNGTLSVIDLTERKVIAVIPVGAAPLGVAINPTGSRVFVANEGSFSLSVIDTSTNQPFIDLNVPNLAANPYPRGVAAHPNPLIPLVYVTNRTVNSFSDDAANPYVDQCDALVARPPINVNPDQCVGSLSIFDADLKTQVGSVAVGWAPEGVAVHPNGQYVYVANSGDRTVSVMETVFNRVIGIITLDEFGGAPQPLVPRGVAVSPDGQRLYVTDGAGDRLFVIDTTANHAVVSIVQLRLDDHPRVPYGVSVSPDNRRVYVANTANNTVSVVGGWNAAASQVNRVIAEIPVGLGPWAFGQFMGPLATVAAPSFDPPSGFYQGSLRVTITSPTAGASIRYTMDGSIPTPTAGALLANGQSITLACPSSSKASIIYKLKAIAFKEGWADSEVTETAYTIIGQ